MKIKNINTDNLKLNEGQLEGLPQNPRFIRDERFEALKKSIYDAPEMLALRELLVYPLDDTDYIVIGGNMRLRAAVELGYNELPCKVLDKELPVEKLREYVIKDNEAFGQPDWTILADEWQVEELKEWGMECNFLEDAQGIDFSKVEEITQENYETPKAKMLECPKCHHKDFAIHFKSFESDAIMEDQDGVTNEEEI